MTAETTAADGSLNAEEDPGSILPVEAARAALLHWWREPVAGLLSVGIGVWDAWHFGRDAGLTANIDELLILGGIILVAGSRRLFPAAPGMRMAGGNAAKAGDS